MFTSIAGAPIGIANAGLTLFSSLTTGIVKKLLNITKSEEKKHDKILMLAKSKLNSIVTFDVEISHEEFVTILIERDMYKKMKENLKN